MAKIRLDFVTNSSSSSFICIAKVDMCDELKQYMAEEYGSFGTRLLNEYVQTGSDIANEQFSDVKDILAANEMLDLQTYYLGASFIEWSSEGDSEGDDAFLYRAIPNRFMQEIYDGQGR